MNDGGSAFPRTTHHRHSNGGSIHTDVDTTPGMTLRDYFAAAALTGSFSSPAATAFGAAAEDHNQNVEDFMSEMAYEFADAMLKAREKVK